MAKRFLSTAALLILCLAAVLIVFSANADGPASKDASQPALTFVVFGDNQPSTPDSAQSETFKKILRDMDSLNPDLAVSTGDRIYGSGSAKRLPVMYADFVETAKTNLRASVYQALGNHEILGSRSNEQFFANELGSLYYSFDRGDVHFIILDSEVVGQAGRIAGDQLAWLKEDLYKARAARFKFVFLHRPLYPVDGHMGKCLDKYPAERDALHKLFVQNRITAVFSGHEHLFSLQYRNGVRFIITGGGGGFLYPSVDGKGDFHHYIAVTIDGDKLKMQVVKPALQGKPREVIDITSTR